MTASRVPRVPAAAGDPGSQIIYSNADIHNSTHHPSKYLTHVLGSSQTKFIHSAYCRESNLVVARATQTNGATFCDKFQKHTKKKVQRKIQGKGQRIKGGEKKVQLGLLDNKQ